MMLLLVGTSRLCSLTLTFVDPFVNSKCYACVCMYIYMMIEGKRVEGVGFQKGLDDSGVME
ncbi:hypothetical protein HanRHA438_Chr06g0287101 [Helianthus annuus]|nr:hypothetical protein HanIR_Chr06g0299011 [Helianthus annuus]KAJ0913571.1 hypothetical protein HanRHA438_Chr06g0287101 [Helianthus annuus]